MMKKLMCGVALAASMTTASMADDSGVTFDGYFGLASDLRDRGLSLSGKDPVVVASLGVFSDKGFYGGVMSGLIDKAGDVKAEFYAGYQIDKGDYIYDLSVELDSYHGDGYSDYYPEFKASVARDYGLAFIRMGAAYAPDGRWSDPNRDSFYMYTDLEIPVPNIPELTVISRLGYDMRQDRSDLWDWSVGLSVFVEQVELSVSYEDSTRNSSIGDGAVVVGARFYF